MKKSSFTFVLLFILFSVFNIHLFAQNIDEPVISASPNPLIFDDTYAGSNSQKILYITNNGDETLEITDYNFSTPEFLTYASTPKYIEPGNTFNLVIQFFPGSEATYNGTLNIINNDPANSSLEVSLKGEGILSVANGWEWIPTGFDYILTDIEFPEGQDQIGYAVGETLTYNGDGIVIKTTDGGTTWSQLTPDGIPGLEAMSFVSIDTGYVAGWDDYVIKTTNGGLTWDTLNVSTGMWIIGDIEFWDADHGVLLESTKNFVTTDGGETWVESTGINKQCHGVDYASETTLFATGYDNVFKSTDGGFTWTIVLENAGLFLGIDFLNENYGMATGDYGLIVTTLDGGTSWSFDQQVGDQLLHRPFIWDEDTAWVCGTPELIYKSTDGGTTWNFDYPSNYQKAFYRITFTDNYTGFVCGGSNGIVLRKKPIFDGAELSVSPNPIEFEDTFIDATSYVDATFANTGTETLDISNITFTNPVFGIQYTTFSIEPGESGAIPVSFTPDSEGTFEGVMQIESNDPNNEIYEVELSGEGVIELNNGWEWIDTGFDYILMDIEFPEGQDQIGYTVGTTLTYNGEGIVLKTTDGGDTWVPKTTGVIEGLEAISFVDLNTGYVAGQDGIFMKTTDGGETWETIILGSDIFRINDIEFWDENTGIATAHTFGTHITTDGGTSWTECTGLTILPHEITLVGSDTVYLVGENGVNRSVDGGFTFIEVGDPALLLGSDFLNADIGMVVGDYGVISQTANGGDTWTTTQPLGDLLLRSAYHWDEDTIYICGTPEYIYKSVDGGLNWESDFTGNWEEALYRITFTDNYTGFVCGSGGIVVRKKVPAQPWLSVTPNPYVYDDTYVGVTATSYFTFENNGSEPLDITDITFTDPAFSIDYTAFTIQPGESGDLPVYFSPDVAGLYEATMEIYSNDPVNDPYTVGLSGNGIVDLNSGWEWIETGFDFILMDIEFPEGQNQIGYAVGEDATYNGDGIVIKTIDGGTTWEQITPDGIPGLEAMSFVDLQTGYVAGWDDYVLKTVDGGLNWDTLNVATDMWIINDIEFYDYDNGIIMEGSNVYLTEDGGDSWSLVNTFDFGCFEVVYADQNTVFTEGYMNKIYKSIDGGYSWTEVYSSMSTDHILLGIDFLDENYGVAVGDYGYIITTNDGGETWYAEQPVGDQLLRSAFIWDADTTYVCGTPEQVYKTTNGGIEWISDFDGNWEKALYRVTFTDNYTGFICGGSGGIVLRKASNLVLEPEIEVNPLSIDFGTTIVGESLTEPITINNLGNAPLHVTDITSSNSVFTVDITSFDIPPGGSQVVEVTFLPDEEDDFEGYLEIENNDANNSIVEVELSGIGINTAPLITVDPDEFEFDDTNVGEYSTEMVEISNIGNETLIISDISSINSVFSVDATSFTIEPGLSEELNITFTPNEGGLFEGIIEIESNDSQNNPMEVVVSGLGLAYPTIEVEPLEILFDTTDINTGLSVETFQVTNSGIATLNVTNISSSNEAYSVDPISFDLEPEESQIVEVSFDPDQIGWFYANINIENNDPENETVEVSVSGVGAILTMVSENDIDKDVVVYPNPATEVIHIENVQGKEIFIYDFMGKLQLTEVADEHTMKLNVSTLIQGTYLIKIVDNNSVIIKKLMISK